MKKIRLYLGISLIKLSNLFYRLSRILCVCILKPGDLAKLTRRCYAGPGYLKGCANQEYANAGLQDTEKSFAGRYLKKADRALVAGCGSGRECLALAKLGVKVTGIDYIAECVEAARGNARSQNLSIEFIHRDITDFDLSGGHEFEAVIFSASLYSLIPSRDKRIEVLKKITPYLAPGGKIFLNFASGQSPDTQTEKKAANIKKILSRFCGNNQYQEGDEVEGDGEFKHYFSPAQIKDEVLACGLRLEELNLEDRQNSFCILSVNPEFPVPA